MKGYQRSEIGVFMICLVWVLFLSSFTFAAPSLMLNNPTEPNGAILHKSETVINLTLTENDLDSFGIAWNGRNYTLYDSSLLLGLNLNKNSVLGENETLVLDFSKNGNNGTLHGNPLWTYGKYNKGLLFDGSNDYIDLGNGSSLNPSTGSITIGLWIYLSSDPDCDGNNNWRSILYKGSKSSTLSGYDLILEQYRSITFDVGNGTQRQRYNGGKIPLNSWTHITATYDSSSSESKVYIDDSEVQGTYWSNMHGRIASNSNKIFINTASSSCPSIGGGFNGIIDEVRIYNKALSAEEVKFDYNTEFSKTNVNEYRFFNNLSLDTGNYTYFSWANNTNNQQNQTEMRTLSIPCITPFSGMEIRNSIVLCQGAYQLNANTNTSALYIKKDNLKIIGNNTRLIGNNKNNYGLRIDQYSNLTIKNLEFNHYNRSVYLSYVTDSTIENITSGNASMGIYLYDSENVTINNSVILDYKMDGIHSALCNSLVISSSRINISTLDFIDPNGMRVEGGENIIINGNVLQNLDKGISISSSASNITIKNNLIENATSNTDSYDSGIFLFTNITNVIIFNNTLGNIGSVGILVMKNCSGINIKNNSIDNYNLSLINDTLSNDYFEPPAGIFISEIYKRWVSDCSERDTDNINKISSYASWNIVVSGNTFGPNVQIPLRIQGRHNITEDLNNYWYRKIQLPTHLVDADEFYISDNYNMTKSFSGRTSTDNHMKGYGDYNKSITITMLFYHINRSLMEFRNYNNSIVYNVSLFFPRFVLFNLSSTASSDRVNVSLPVNMLWYHTINFSVTPSVGLVDVLVTNYNSNFVGWFENRSSSGSVGYDVCSFPPGSSVVYRVNGVVVDVFVVNGSGCVGFNYSGGTARSWMDLSSVGNGSVDLSVSPSDFVLPGFVRGDSNVLLNVSIHNIGSASSGPFYVRFMDDANVIGTQKVNGLASGATGIVSVNWLLNVTGARNLWVAVDYNNSIIEGNESDNSVLASVFVSTPPDLSVVPADIVLSNSTPVEFQTVNITVTVRNLGFENASNVSVECWDGLRSSGTFIGSSVTDILGGSLETLNYSWNASILNTHALYVYVDPDNTITEGSKDNNVAYKGVVVYSSSGTVSLLDVVNAIGEWLEGRLNLSDVVTLITRWAGL